MRWTSEDDLKRGWLPLYGMEARGLFPDAWTHIDGIDWDTLGAGLNRLECRWGTRDELMVRVTSLAAIGLVQIDDNKNMLRRGDVKTLMRMLKETGQFSQGPER
jgi:hypothetical protein